MALTVQEVLPADRRRRWRPLCRALAAGAAVPAASLCLLAACRVLPALLPSSIQDRASRLPESSARQLADATIRCGPPRTPEVFGVISSMPPVEIQSCGDARVTEFRPINVQIVDLSHVAISRSTEVVLVAERQGQVFVLEVTPDGDRKSWDLSRDPLQVFGSQSCLDSDSFCDVASVRGLRTGFLVLDRHRILEYNSSWKVTDTPDQAASFGQMNARGLDPMYKSLYFPGFAAPYMPYNATHLAEYFEISPLFPHASNRFFLITDTGNHRVILMNATFSGQMDYVAQFGVLGQPMSNQSGLNWPWGIDVFSPACESRFHPTFANVFVADRRNSRLVKLDVGYPPAAPGADRWLRPSLTYGGEYGGPAPGGFVNQSLLDPTGVAVFRHYVLVLETLRNCITVLTVNYRNTRELTFVTRLTAQVGISLLGSLAASPAGYVWYTYKKYPDTYAIASLVMARALNESKAPSLLQDFRATCVNDTWVNLYVRRNLTLYMDYMGFALNASGINWLFPERKEYVDIMGFNLSTRMDFDALNRTVFLGQMVFCQPPPPPTSPPMLSGDSLGWRLPGVVRSITAGACGSRPSVLILLCGLFLFGDALADRRHIFDDEQPHRKTVRRLSL